MSSKRTSRHPAPGPGFPAVVLAVLLSIALVPAVAALEEPKGSVDWVGGFIQGVGQGTAKPSGNRVQDRLNALRAAEVVAQRALGEAIHGVRVDGATAVRDAVRQYVLESRVQGIVRGARKVKAEVSWEGNVPLATVELRVCLAADAPECRAGGSVVGMLADTRKGEPAYVPSESFRGDPVPPAGIPPVSNDSSRPVTGLILRVEGVRFERELFPVVVTRDPGGRFLTVYSARSVKPEIVRTHGVARYVDTPDQAATNPLLGGNPLVVVVTEVTRENMLVVRPDSAKAIRETTRYGNDYLADAKVVVAGRPAR